MGRRGRFCGATAKGFELEEKCRAHRRGRGRGVLAAVREQPGATARGSSRTRSAVRSERVRDCRGGRCSRPASSSTSATGGATLSISADDPTLPTLNVRPDRDERGVDESSATGGVSHLPVRPFVPTYMRDRRGGDERHPRHERRKRTRVTAGSSPPARSPSCSASSPRRCCADARGELPAIRLATGALRYARRARGAGWRRSEAARPGGTGIC